MAEESKKNLKSETALTEEKTLKFWRENKIFEKSLAKKSPKGEFVFYEGPPTANGMPGIHHLEARAFKDIIPRYKTMQGFHVARKGGWDTHGLPVELQVEKKLGLKSKKEIEAYGIEAFNRKCKESVWEYLDVWNTFTSRIGYWLDQENPYITYEKTYMESVWNILKTVSDEKVSGKELVYKDYKVVPWCPRCGTALSSHELAQGYEDVKDLSVIVEFRIKNKAGESSNIPVSFLAWTTTPWTLPGNVALAVNPKISYVEIEKKDMVSGSLVRFILAKDRLETVLSFLSKNDYRIVMEMKGSDLIGLEYEPLYPYLSEKFAAKNPEAKEAFAKAFKVYAADFVTTTDGTGIVHTAVMYGQEDFELGTKIGLPKFHLVSEDGHFLSEMGFLSSRYVKEKNEAGKPTLDVDIIDDLKKKGLFFNQENHKHSYPHCWRCKTPLIYYARDSWYIRMSGLREKLVRENENINWEPSHIKEGRFGEWLREVKDWAISRERYWGTPLPIWEATDGSGEKLFIGSVDGLNGLKELLPKRNNYFLMRHGESEANANGSVISSSLTLENPLTTLGESQVKKAAKKLRGEKIDIIISSPFSRAKQSVEILSKEIDFQGEFIFDERIGEMRVKNWDGKAWGEYQSQFANVADRFKKNVGPAENYEDVRARVAAFMYEIDAKYEGKNILIVGHGAPLTLIDLSSRGYSVAEMAEHYYEKDFENAEVREIDWRNLPHNDKFEIDLHRPFIDAVELTDKTGRKFKRVKEVLDVWFDSGAMPFAQHHFPFGEKSEAQKSGILKVFRGDQKIPYPADYISEAIDQTRGWFYTLHAIGVLMGKGNAYKNVICLGHILDGEGKKMSKSLGNIVDPWVMIDKYGVDALRMWMYTVNQPGDSKNFDERSVDDIVKKVFNLAINIAALYELYSNNNSVEASDTSSNVLDKWIIARLNQLTGEGADFLNNFKVFEAARAMRDFLSDFSTWYIRRSRDRFKSEDKKEREEVLGTTRFVLLELSKYMAPFTPFFAENLYGKVKLADSESVHLEAWPKGGKVDERALEEMAEVRRTVSLALELRAKAGAKVRQPLSTLTLKSDKLKNKKELIGLITDEVNVKEVVFDEKAVEPVLLNTTITPELEEEGNLRDLIRAIQDLRKKEKLNQGDQISLKIITNSKGVDLARKYSNEITKNTNLKKIEIEFASVEGSGAVAGAPVATEKFEAEKIKFEIIK